MQAEIAAMKKLKEHPNILQIKKVYSDIDGYKLVMEHYNCGNLMKYITDVARPISEHTVATIAIQLLQAVSYCHSK